ncbi:GntR family transcriptional regulator, partial [Staphylococcus aureus]|nr:GntR family transcriptional regulator [Staphylococcus aureus]
MSLVVRTLSEQIFTIIRERIISGDLPEEQPIRQDALANELGVSKIPLREALARLEQEGLLTSQANRGFFVRSLGAGEAEEIYELRLSIEPNAAARASRPVWGEAEVALAYVELLAHGADSPQAIRALAQSYAAAPYLRDSAPWRIRFGVTVWSRLDAQTRDH